jgi:hypothetical protein
MDKYIRSDMDSHMLGMTVEVNNVAPFPVSGHTPGHTVLCFGN